MYSFKRKSWSSGSSPKSSNKTGAKESTNESLKVSVKAEDTMAANVR